MVIILISKVSVLHMFWWNKHFIYLLLVYQFYKIIKYMCVRGQVCVFVCVRERERENIIIL
jgi:hypothetical protein